MTNPDGAVPIIIRKKNPAICPYCRIKRQEIVSPEGKATAIQKIGITGVGGNKWRVLWCGDCGSIELFQELIAQAVFFGFRIGDVPIPARYFEGASSINMAGSIKYGIQTLFVMAKYLIQKIGLYKFRIFNSRSS